VDGNEPYKINFMMIKELLRPVCRYDPSQSEKYRDSKLLKNILSLYIQSYTNGKAMDMGNG
jgi:hypothetical protein